MEAIQVPFSREVGISWEEMLAQKKEKRHTNTHSVIQHYCIRHYSRPWETEIEKKDGAYHTEAGERNASFQFLIRLHCIRSQEVLECIFVFVHACSSHSFALVKYFSPLDSDIISSERSSP